MEKKLTNSGPLRESTRKHSIYSPPVAGDQKAAFSCGYAEYFHSATTCETRYRGSLKIAPWFSSQHGNHNGLAWVSAGLEMRIHSSDGRMARRAAANF
jgi:hypothetical protein